MSVRLGGKHILSKEYQIQYILQNKVIYIKSFHGRDSIVRPSSSFFSILSTLNEMYLCYV